MADNDNYVPEDRFGNPSTIDTTAPHIGSPLAGLGPETIKKIALQSRPLTTKESAAINKAFNGSVDPEDVRIAFDAGMAGTNMTGYVLSKHLPTVVFLSSAERGIDKNEVPEDLLHEATHVWQNLTNNKYVGTGVPSRYSKGLRPAQYEYESPKVTGKTFTAYGNEQQAEMQANNESSARAFIQAHKASKPLSGDMAFLDSVRSRYMKDTKGAQLEKDHPGTIVNPALYNAVQKDSFSTVDWSSGQPKFKLGNIMAPKINGGTNHLRVLENLRTKHPEYRGVGDGKLLAALLHTHPEYAQHVGPTGLRMALEAGHKP